MVLDLILKDNAGNKFIEANRGKLFRSLSQEAEDLNEESEHKAIGSIWSRSLLGGANISP